MSENIVGLSRVQVSDIFGFFRGKKLSRRKDNHKSQKGSNDQGTKKIRAKKEGKGWRITIGY